MKFLGKYVAEGSSSRRERCEYCNTPLNDMGTCPKCDDGEEERFDEAMGNKSDNGKITVEKFWEYVCNGNDTEVLDACVNGKVPTKFYYKFGQEHSYIMGAIRTGHYSTAKILLSFGEKLAKGEGEELAFLLISSKGRN